MKSTALHAGCACAADHPDVLLIFISSFWNSATAFATGTLTLRMGARASSSSRLKTWLERVIGGAFVGLGVKPALSKQ
jgi:threonine/homoserine/homoserine lactone efflux protein